MHPIVLAPLTWPADGLPSADLANVLFGLVWRCATWSAQYTTDYAITDSVVAMMAGPNWAERAAQAERAGYWTRDQAAGGWQLVDDAEHMFHIRRRAEIDWERARKADAGNPNLVVPVRLRDGDGCRYCGHVVHWSARRGNRAGTYDHRVPGQPARTPDDLVVACGLCNRRRGDDPDALPLRPVPERVFYSEESARFLARHGHQVVPTAMSDPAPSGTTPAPLRAPATPRPAGPRTDLPIPVGTADQGYPADRTPGRVGTPGRSGQGRRRGGRGRRGRGAGGSAL